MKISPSFCLLAALWLAPLPSYADLEAGLEAITRRDFAVAARIFQPLAEQGNAAAQINLGNLYMKGWGVEQDYAAALRWFRKAADQGERMAQTKLGILYYHGLGVEKATEEAANWFRKAAEQGERSAQSILGSLYTSGEGVKQDLSLAFYWYTLAEEQGDEEAGRGRKSVEEEMTPGQKDEALRLLSEVRKRNIEEEEKSFEQATASLTTPQKTSAMKPHGHSRHAKAQARKKRKTRH
ncbi:MAG: tetratricopeptide repeat protein [Methylococcaceae bacterium]|nr:tetratricopeptide repeat protein [Methylococcaceae bacterium]